MDTLDGENTVGLAAKEIASSRKGREVEKISDLSKPPCPQQVVSLLYLPRRFLRLLLDESHDVRPQDGGQVDDHGDRDEHPHQDLGIEGDGLVVTNGDQLFHITMFRKYLKTKIIFFERFFC